MTSSWSVYQRGDSGDWMLRFKDGEKWRDKRIPRDAGVRTKRAAEEWAREWLSEQAARAIQPQTTVSEYLDRWLERRKKNPKVRASTLANNKGHLELHVKPAFGSTPVAERLGVSQRTARRWLDAGRLPHVRLPGGGVRVSVAQLEQALAARAA